MSVLGGWADPPEVDPPFGNRPPMNRQTLLKTLPSHTVAIDKKYPLLAFMGSYAYRHNAS